MQSRRSTPARGTSHTPRTHARRAATTPGGPGGPGGTGAGTRGRGTRPLTGTQRAYLTGRADDQLHGGVDCLALFEFTGAPVDPDRMRAAVAALRRHPVLRSTVVDGHHVDAGRDARPPLTVAETTGAGTRAALAAEVEGRRRDILARHADHAAGESGWVDILRWRTDDGRDLGVLHIGVSLAVADLAGTGVIVRELAAAYRAAGDGDGTGDAAGTTVADAADTAAGTVTGPWVTFADIAAREAGPDGDRAADRDGDPDGHREGDDATLPPDPLPAGPDIPLVGTPERTVTRHLRRLDPATWAAVGTVAGAVGATRPALLLAVYRHALGLWCGDDDLTVVVPGLDARRTPDDVLDRTRTWAVRPPSAAGRTLGEAATEAGAELRRRIRAGLDSTDEVRALLHRGEGHSGSLPFVLTCGGEETLLTADVEETFGRLTATGSVTPQVLADLQILHLTPGEVCVALDVRDGAFPATFGPELLATVADALERLAAVGAGDTDTATAAPADLPMDRVVRVPRAVAARRAALNAVPPVDDAVATPALHGAWLRQVETRPDATAVVDPARGEDLTYAELHRAACRLAAGLADRVAPGDLVLVRLPKGCDQVTAVLAVLYLGAAYLPVNVDAPAERVRAVTEVAQPVAVLDRVDPGVYDDDPSAGDATADATAAAPDLPRPVDGDDRAYVIFTSGSTGTPKGVVMTHRAATTTVAAVVDRHRIGPDDSVLAVSSLDFDLSVFDIFGLLGAGGTVVCIAEDDRRDAFAWCDLVRRHGVTTWNSAPALAEMLTVAAEDGPALPLRRVLVSGDWVAPTLPARVRAVTGGGGGTGGDAGAAGARVVAMGGATEGGIWSNEHVIDGPGDLDPAWPSVPYGRPLPGQAYRVVDAAGRDVPTGVVGELWIGGASLAAGYLGRADLTAERFVTDADGARWYRTGDHGYWGPGDLLFFVGRRDNQVKIRGHRVELGDVEHHLRAVPGVEAAVVLPAPGNTALRALVTLAGDGHGDGDGDGEGADPSATVADRVREALAATVPGFMVPRDVTVVPELRLTANGKVDRAWAAQVLDGGPAGVAGVSGERTGGAGGDREAGPGAVGGGSVPGADAARAPHDAATAGDAGAGSANADVAADMAAAVASDIAATWADVLDVPVGQLGGERGGDAGERAGEANFFALGGDSVAATAACSRLRALGYRVTVAELFGNPTLDRFTDAVVAAGRDAVDDTADHAAADAVDDGADDAAVPGGGADRAGAADGAAGGDADAGAPFPLTPLQRAYALGTDGIRGTVRAATAYAAVLGLDAAAGYGPTRAGFTYPQVKAAAAGIVARWAGLRVVRDGDDAQRVVDPSDALRVTVLDPSTDLRAHLASATPRVPLELVLPGEEARELGVLVDYLALDGRSLAVVVGALTAVLSGEDPDRTVTVDPTVSVFARHCRALAAGGARADAPDGTGTGTASPATPATPPAAAPEPPTLPVAAGQEPSDAGADTPPAAFTSLRAHIPLATLDRAAARTGATVSAVVLAEFGSALAEASGRGEVGVVVPLTHRPDTGDDREILGTFSRLGVCACPATPDPAATRDALAAVLTADGGVRAASAGRTGRYPAVFTSVLGYDAALAPATRAVRAVWSLTRTPGVLVDCQLTSVDAGTVEVRWDMPDGVLDAAAVDAMFRGMVDRLGGTVVPDVAEITGPLPGGYAPLGDVRPPSTVSALLREVIERLDGEAGARDDALVPWAGPVVAAWRRFVAGGPEATGLADAPVAWSARDAQLLVDVVRGRARRFGILAHPVLSPRALAAAEPTVARALDVLDDRVRRRVGRGERVAVVELGHGIARGGRRGGSGGSVPGDAADSWTVVEPDALVADIATVDGRTCVSDVADVPAPADVVVACGTLHRDPRLRAGLGAVRLAPGAEVHVVEAERPTAATLVSAALVNPAVLDAAGMLSARGWAEVVSDAGLRVRYLEAEDGHSVVLRAVAAEDGEPTAGVAGAVAGVGSDAGSTPGSGDAAGDAAGDAPAAGRPATGQVTGRADVTAALAASWRRHLPGLADGAGADGADGAAAGALPADTDFFVAGGDSLTATRVLADLREVGVTGLRAVDVFNNPTFGALRDRAAAAAAPTAGTGVSDGAGTAPAAGTGAPDSRPAAPPTDTAVPPADGHGTHPLTRVQQAYLAGQDSGQLLGGAPARCLFTFRAAAVDTGRLESAVRAAARRHPVLRTVVTEGPAGTPVARVLDDVPAGVWAVTDGTGATGTDAATTGAPDATGTDAAAALAGHVPDPRAEGPLAVRVSTGPDGATVAVSMNNLLLDGASMMLLMDEIAASYADPATRLDAADASTAPGGAAAAPAADPTAGYLADRPWLTDPAAPVPWQGRMLTPAELDGRLDAVLADLPPAPFVPDRRALAGLTDTTMARVAADVDAATWDTVRAGLAARHVTPAAGVLAAFGRALAAETGGDDLTVTLTRFDRDLSVPGIDRALGDFTSLSLAGLRGLRAGDRTVAERSAQTALAEADDPALDALRLTARAVQTSGDPVAGVFPVVFTCGLGLAGATAQVAGDPAGDAAGTAGRSLRERSFGTQVAASSTTPQVVLDLQVADDRDGLHLTADHLVRVLPAAVADRVVRRTVAELTGAPAGDGGRSRTGEGDDATLPRPRPSAAPDAAAGDAAPDAAEAGATDPAAVIAEVWADVLGLDRVTDGTNFFRAGGDSLTATRCITALRARGVDAALRTLLTTPDLGDFRDAVVGAAGRSASTPSPEDTPTPQPDAAAGTLAPAPTPTPTPQPDTPADPAPTPEPAPEDWFDLTDVQAGYLMGRTDAYDDGGVACQGYSEFVLPVDRMDPASAADPAGAVRRAWRRVVDAHEMLRALVDREGRQRIDRTAGAHVRVIDVAAGETGTGVTAPDPATARAIVRDDLRERNFPVGEAPMVELALTVGDGDPVLHLSVDLIVTDYVGIRSLVRDLDHCLRHPSDPLDAPAATFRQCLEARARHAATPAGRAARERDTRWWRDRLDTLPPALTFSPDPDATGLGGTTRRSHRLDADAWRGLRDTAARLTVTPSGLVLAAFATAARRYADIALGGYTHGRAGTAAATGAGTDTATATGATVGDTPPTPAALITLTTVDRAPVGDDGPSAADIGRIVGDFTSTVVLDLPLGADLAPTARDLQGRLFDALDHPAYPGVRVVRDLRRSGGEDRGRIPVVFTSTVGVDAVEPPQLLRAVPGTAISKTPQVLLDVQLSPDGDGVTMDWDSRDGGFHPAVLDALFADVCEVLDQLAVGVVDVPAARAPEPVVRTRSMNGRLLHGRFLRAALDDADAPAVVHGDRTLTRGELCALAVRLAGGLPAGDAPVAVVLPPGPGQIAAQLAALLTGRAFVPLDPEWPGSRRRAVLDTVREAYAEEVPVVDDATLRAADAPGVPDAAGGSTAGDGAGDGAGDPGAWRDAVRRALAEPPLVDDLAYVIFTSGSTGTPKGVAVTHRQVCTTLDEMEDRLELTAADRVLAVSRPSFDLAVFNVFGVLGAGGAVVVPSCGTVPDPETWARDIRRHGVTVWNSVPAQLTILLDHLGDAATDAALPLRVVLVSGDRVPVDQPARVRALAPGVVVDALGGATEGSIWSIVHRCTPEEDGPAGTAADPSAGSTAGTAPARRSVPYGRALGHQAVWVLDRDGGRAAVGQRGEIVIAGDGVVEGYLGDPVRTAAAFGRHLGTGERCYRTGDVGRYLPDGEIEFCGRVDDGQVKIRGHRIELGEVEAGLRAVDGVADALAAVTGEGDRRELVAVVVPETADTSAAGTAAVPGTAGTAADTAPTSPAAALAAAVTARSRATELDDAERRDFRRIHDLVTDAALDAMTAQIARVTSASPDGTATRDAIVAGTGAQGHGTLMDRWIDELDRAGRVRCADGLLSVTDTDTAAGAATDTDTAAARWEEIHRLDDRLGYGRRQLDYLRTSLDELPGLLEGSVDPLSLLFPGGDMAVARASYGENRLASYLNGVCAAAVGHHARSLVAAGRTCRVLEIGAGVGGTTADVLAELADLTDPTDRPGPGVDYLFTDVSRYFTDAAAQEWPQVRTGLFDINTDPAEQGVEPGSVDVVLCANVLHNARDIDVALRRVAGMLAPGGVLVVIDSTATNAPLMASMEFKEGLGDATDARLGTGSPFLTFAQWREAVAASPLESVAVLPEAGSVLELGAQHVFIVRKPEVRAGSGEGLDAARVRTAAADVLPASMRPRRVGVVAALPMTANGKRDRAAVAALVAGARPGGAAGGAGGPAGAGEPEPAASAHVDAVAAGPVTTAAVPADPSAAPAEPAAPADPAAPAAPADPVVDAWREVLDLDPSVPVPGDADFHDLGGDSLLLARCIGQMRRATGREDLPSWDETLRAIVADPTVDGCRRALGLTAPGAGTPDPAPAAGTGRHRADTDPAGTPATAPTTAPAPSPAATGGPTVTVVDRAASSPTGGTPHPAGGPRLTRLLPAPGGRPDPWDPATDPATGGTPDLTVVVHDGSGGTGPYTALLRELAARDAGPVVGIERSAGDGYLTTPADELFHDLTERYTVSVLDTGARRVHVVGYCMGGLLAAGIADRLAACGVEATATVMSSYRIPFTVHDEILLDFSFARLMGCRPQDMGIDVDEDALGRALRAAREDGHDDITAGVLHRYADDDLRAQLARAPRTSAERVGRFLRTEAGRPWSRESLDALREVYVHSLAAVAAWSEPPVTVPVTFLRQRDPLSFLPDLGDDMTSFWVDGCLGGLDVVDVDGDHFTCLDAAHAPTVADLVVARAPWAGDAGGQDERDGQDSHDEQHSHDEHDEQVGPAVGTTPTDREEDR